MNGIMKSLKNEKCKTSVTNDDMCIQNSKYKFNNYSR